MVSPRNFLVCARATADHFLGFCLALFSYCDAYWPEKKAGPFCPHVAFARGDREIGLFLIFCCVVCVSCNGIPHKRTHKGRQKRIQKKKMAKDTIDCWGWGAVPFV
nr:hypothetical protein [Pandoravirus massiliensis]